MWIFEFGVPVLALLGFGHAVYEVFTGKIDAEKMGLQKQTLDMFGVANLFMVVCWACCWHSSCILAVSKKNSSRLWISLRPSYHLASALAASAISLEASCGAGPRM